MAHNIFEILWPRVVTAVQDYYVVLRRCSVWEISEPWTVQTPDFISLYETLWTDVGKSLNMA